MESYDFILFKRKFFKLVSDRIIELEDKIRRYGAGKVSDPGSRYSQLKINSKIYNSISANDNKHNYTKIM